MSLIVAGFTSSKIEWIMDILSFDDDDQLIKESIWNFEKEWCELIDDDLASSTDYGWMLL